MCVRLSFILLPVCCVLKERYRLAQLAVAVRPERSDTPTTIIRCENASSRVIDGDMGWASSICRDLAEATQLHRILIECEAGDCPRADFIDGVDKLPPRTNGEEGWIFCLYSKVYLRELARIGVEAVSVNASA